jgi:Tfp pilus assembly protein PilF
MNKLDLIFYALIIAALAVGTYERNRIWQTDLSLWEDCTMKSPDKERPYLNLGAALIDRGRFSEARFYLEEALRHNGPNRFKTLHNLGVVCREEKKFDEATSYFKRALEISPHNSVIRRNLALNKYREWKEKAESNKQ